MPGAFSSREEGVQILEFALVLPLLVVFVVAIFDFGQAFNVKEKLNFAAKDAARFGAAQPTNDLTQTVPVSVTAIRDLVDADLINAGINDCGLGPIQLTASMTWSGSAHFAPSGLGGAEPRCGSSSGTNIE